MIRERETLPKPWPRSRLHLSWKFPALLYRII